MRDANTLTSIEKWGTALARNHQKEILNSRKFFHTNSFLAEQSKEYEIFIGSKCNFGPNGHNKKFFPNVTCGLV